MDYFFILERPSNYFLHHKSVLKNVSIRASFLMVFYIIEIVPKNHSLSWFFLELSLWR